jgi:hypothetical protein
MKAIATNAMRWLFQKTAPGVHQVEVNLIQKFFYAAHNLCDLTEVNVDIVSIMGIH